MANTTPTAAPPLGGVLSDGQCDATNPLFLILSAATAVGSGLVALMSYRCARAPVPGTADYGGPWEFATLLMSIAVYGMWPQVAYFVVFKIFKMPIAMAEESGCQGIEQPPFVPVIFFVLVIYMFATHRAKKVIEEVAETPILDNTKLLGTPSVYAHATMVDVDGGESAAATAAAAFRRMPSAVSGVSMSTRCGGESAGGEALEDEAEPQETTPEAVSSSSNSTSGPGVADFATACPPDASPHRVVFLGVDRGLLQLERIRRERAAGAAASTETWIVDYMGDGLNAAHVRNNALAEGLVDDADAAGVTEAIHLLTAEAVAGTAAEGSDGRPLRWRIPAGDAFFDSVVVSPGLRLSAPIGGFLTDDAIKRKRMLFTLAEGLRVLKPHGNIVCVDMAYNVPLVAADVRDLLGLDVEPATSLIPNLGRGHNLWAEFRTTKPPGWRLAAAPKDVVQTCDALGGGQRRRGSGSVDDIAVEHTALLTGSETRSGGSVGGTDVDAGAADPADAAFISMSAARLVSEALHLVMFAALSFGACAVFAPTNYPLSLPMSERFNHLILTLAMAFPLMAMVIRERLILEQHHRAYSTLLWSSFRAGLVAILVMSVLIAVFGAPPFLFAVLLSDVGVPGELNAMIGVIAGLALAGVMYKHATGKRWRRVLKARGLDPQKYMAWKW